MNTQKSIKTAVFFTLLTFMLNSCGTPGDARKSSPNPRDRAAKNLEEGKGFRLMDTTKKLGGSRTFEFASSNELWRASLDTIDFMPLASVNYSGGIIITDWYSTENSNESIKVSIRFLTNEIRSDALDIKVFNKKCTTQNNCVISQKTGNLITELKSKILRYATIYEKEKKDKNFKPYIQSTPQKKN
tara:strand:+ start:243 stop:803 length:561 start_codon:yes stop_codon:yes gene_type:complete